MKILITGGCGFVGSNLALKLDPEHEIHSLDNFSKSESKLNEGLLQKRDIPVVKGSISDKEFVDDLIKDLKPDCVIHLAAQVAMTDSIEDPQNDFNINFASYSLIAPRTILIILFLNLLLNLVIFILSFKEEKAIRNVYIDCER